MGLVQYLFYSSKKYCPKYICPKEPAQSLSNVSDKCFCRQLLLTHIPSPGEYPTHPARVP
jgi:hypothetical protein